MALAAEGLILQGKKTIPQGKYAEVKHIIQTESNIAENVFVCVRE